MVKSFHVQFQAVAVTRKYDDNDVGSNNDDGDVGPRFDVMHIDYRR